MYATFLQRLIRYTGAISLVLHVVAAVALVLGCVYVALGVLGRATGWYLLEGAEQFGVLSLTITFYLGLAYGLRNGSLVRVAALSDRAGPLQFPLLVARHVLSLAVIVVLEYYVWRYLVTLRASHQLTLDSPQIEVFWPVLGILIGNTGLALEMAVTTLRVLSRGVIAPYISTNEATELELGDS